MRPLKTRWIAAWIGLVLMGSPAAAHHSYAMFDMENGIEMEGMVKQFRWVTPHSFITLVVKSTDGATTEWTLEGAPTEGLARVGWKRDTLKPGDELTITVYPLRSGAPGGAWLTKSIHFRNGDPVAGGRTDAH